ncbi:FixH family protein [Ureibacillus aquaedulcis]|uniref:FixH family protein n=1 Tax=Ureibacillus aquaedulcis TaxID=3058421 RepID=A0ABT8GWC3_9BACL|nr:FixH family protein [Ureibacillus sp. BA0131]MDN4495251.1 FixH family protein [Ureibacillus sp. BA0131]
MEKMKFLLFVLTSCLLLSACSLKEDAADLYKKESPLEAEVILPDAFLDDQQETIEVLLTQDGKEVNGADYVHFEIWKQDGSLHYNMEPAKAMGYGLYALSKDFHSDGLYYLKVHASSNGSVISPQMQFVVGELSKEELKILQQDLPATEGGHEHHH